MITFTKIGSLGRLGNQMFQYAALRGLSLKNGYEVKIPNPKSRAWQGQKCLLGEFNIEASYLESSDLKNIVKRYNEPSWKTIDKNFFDILDNTDISGFFQSTFYFEEFAENIKKELRPKEHHIQKNKMFIDEIKNKYPEYELVSVHIRRGDNTQGLNNGVASQIYPKIYDKGGLYFQYFEKAKKIFEKKKVKYIVFSGGARGSEDNKSDIDWCKSTFKGNDYIFSDGCEPLDDFCRIMLCDHNIMCHISSFGWWAAFLNENENKIVTAPKFYHPEDQSLIRTKFYPKEFKII